MATKTKPEPKAPAATEVGAPAPPAGMPGVLPVADLRPSPTNPRRSFPEESLRALADSIASVGVRQRLLVRPVPEAGHPAARFDEKARSWVGVDHFEIIAGERRFRASQLAGLERVPVDVCFLTDDQVLLVQLVENDQREDVKPSEQAVAYKRLVDAGRNAEQVAADTGKSVGFVRGLLRLARLPAWALAAVDAGTLPRATAELVARVPGEEARKRAAACVLLGTLVASELGTLYRSYASWEQAAIDVSRSTTSDEILSYRDTKDLIKHDFQIELKSAPFDRKALDLLPSAGSCEACPKRAGNDPEATAEGTRADVCLDPDCYRSKLAAYREQEVARAAEKGIEEAPVDDGFGNVPRGWCEVSEPVWKTELHTDFPAGHNQNPKREEKLAKVLGKECPQKYIAFDRAGAAVTLVKTTEARAALVKLGVLKKPERAKAAPATPARKKGQPSAPSGPAAWEIDERALVTATKVLAEYGEEQFAELDQLEDSCANGPVVQGLRLVARAFAYEHAMTAEVPEVLDAVFPNAGNWNRNKDKHTEDMAAIDKWSAAKCLGFLLRLAAGFEMFEGPNSDTGEQLLAFAELDWPALQEQARRELTPAEPAIPQTTADVSKPKTKGGKSK